VINLFHLFSTLSPIIFDLLFLTGKQLFYPQSFIFAWVFIHVCLLILVCNFAVEFIENTFGGGELYPFEFNLHILLEGVNSVGP